MRLLRGVIGLLYVVVLSEFVVAVGLKVCVSSPLYFFLRVCVCVYVFGHFFSIGIGDRDASCVGSFELLLRSVEEGREGEGRV